MSLIEAVTPFDSEHAVRNTRLGALAAMLCGAEPEEGVLAALLEPLCEIDPLDALAEMMIRLGFPRVAEELN